MRRDFWEIVDLLREVYGYGMDLADLLAAAWKDGWLSREDDSYMQRCLVQLESHDTDLDGMRV